MKTLITLLLSISISLPVLGQKRTVDVGNFSELSLGIAGTVYLKQGSSNKVEIECEDDIYDEIEFEMRGDRLVIKKEGNWSWGNGWRKSEVDIYVTMKEIEGLSVSGSGLIEGHGMLETEDIELSVSGSGDMDLELNSDEMEMRISGSGSIRLSGNAEEAQARISGSGKVKAEDLTVKIFSARISGSGSCYINATEEIDASISGSGSVYYSGDPDRVISNSSGSGKVRKM
ncbi:head GIN domain-containing protein [Ekhidna sp. To15]|uniref:head GIN domain-containing protein n=1 Tax=Ekhidna sp. To15 TaxID=3395267 RepID=UPI003F520B95